MNAYGSDGAVAASGVVTNRFVLVGDGFEVEHAGPIIRIWCGGCDKHGHLHDDAQSTVEAAKAVHRCGERDSPWDRGEYGVRL